MQNAVIRWVVILGAIALVGIIGTQAYWVMTTWDLNEEEFDEKVNLGLYKVAQALAEFNEAELPTRDIIKQRTSNYWIVNMAVEIDDRLLEYLLQRELEALALNVDFEYAVFDCESDEMVYGGYCNYTPDGEKTDLGLGNLPKDREFTYYFGVKFPGRQGFLFDKMQLIMFLSVILLLTVLFFAYAMWVILRQKRLSEMQKDFINNMTHEFKTPLSTIKIAAGVFKNDERVQADDRLQRYANIILEQNQRLNNQVEKVLQIASIEKRNIDLKKERIALASVLNPLLESVRLRIDETDGMLTTDFAQLEQIYLEADRLHLTNILYNLLDNALKYTRGKADIVVRARRQNGRVQVRVEDHGIGISAANQHQIFDKFYRVPTGNIHNVKGFGLGLFYVKRVCEAHAWNIQLDSREGEGTQVTLTLGKALRAPQAVAT
ncbi:MAG: HAMP domain-containing sensor histidine kinase [Bacteroidota bacterium]